MITHTLYSLTVDESRVVSAYLIPQIGLARMATARLFDRDGDGPTRQGLYEMIDRIESRYNQEQLAKHAPDREDPDMLAGPHYATPFPLETLKELREVAELVLSEAIHQSDPNYWKALGLPSGDDLGAMRVKTCRQIVELTDSLDNDLKQAVGA